MADFSKLTVDNITYNVKDDVARDKTIYTNTEKIVGKWINNKPIYRKILTISSTIAGGGNIGSLDNIDELVNMSGGYTSSADSKFPIFFYLNNTYYLRTWIWNNDVYYDCQGYVGYKGYVIIEYTKTTD